jgi:NADPH:quinone reductase-like Zn-dependent oxidoreductase
MRAVRFHDYGPPDVLRVETGPRPEPGEGEVLVRVHSAGVNPIDWKYRAGYLKEFMPLELPHIPGFDLAGTVAEVGAGVSDLSPGDEVFGRGSGTYAEYAVAPATTLALKPAGVSFDQAATLAIGGVTAWAGLFEAAKLERGQRLLVHGGAGGVGSFVVQLGCWKGAHVIATASAGNLDLVRRLGADEGIDHTAVRFEDEVHDLDVVFDTVGGEVTERSWGVLRPDGMLGCDRRDARYRHRCGARGAHVRERRPPRSRAPSSPSWPPCSNPAISTPRSARRSRSRKPPAHMRRAIPVTAAAGSSCTS